MPSILAEAGTTASTIDLTWTISAGDTNWYRYEIYYEACNPCTVTQGSGGETLKAEVDVATSSTTLTGLNASTIYTINIWAVDTFGNSVSTTQITPTTTP